MKVLVIGGTRFIGPPTVTRLESAGHTVARFSRGNSKTTEFSGDRSDLTALSKAFEEYKPDIVLDLCAYFEPQIDVLIQAIGGSDIRICLVSSCDVYRQFGGLLGSESGPPSNEPITEEGPLRSSLYPFSGEEVKRPGFETYDKIPIESKALERGGVVVRLPMVYGPLDRQYRTFGYASQMQKGRQQILLGSQQAQWKTTRAYVNDIAVGIALAIERGGRGEVFNLCEPTALTEREWVIAIGKAIGWKGSVVTIDEEFLPTDLVAMKHANWHLIMDSSKARTELGYKESLSSEDALRQTVEWELSNPPEQYEAPNFELIDKVIAERSEQH